MQQPDEELIKHSRLEVETDLKALTEVLQWFEELTAFIPQPSWSDCQVALAEGFTNAVRHAHFSLPPTTRIEVEVKVFTYHLEIRIWDWGQPFDMEAKLRFLSQKLQSLSWEDIDIIPEGGRGLMFMKQLTDELAYLRTPNQQNCLVMKKRIGD